MKINKWPTEQQEDLFTGPGEKLKLLREEKGLPVEDIAARLCLTKQKIMEIEKDDYSHISSPIFARGYLRSYAKLLDISNNEILNILQKFDGLGLSGESGAAYSKAATHKTKFYPKRNRHYLRWINIAIIILLIVLVALWWQSKNKNTVKPESLNKAVQQIITIIPSTNQQDQNHG